MKLCKDCRYYATDINPNPGFLEMIFHEEIHPCRWHMCNHPELVSPINGASGDAETLRMVGECGKEAKYWEAKD